MNIEELKQIFREQEEEEEKTARELAEAKREHQRQAQAERQRRSNNLVYILSLAITGASVLATIIFFMVLLIKY